MIFFGRNCPLLDLDCRTDFLVDFLFYFIFCLNALTALRWTRLALVSKLNFIRWWRIYWPQLLNCSFVCPYLRWSTTFILWHLGQKHDLTWLSLLKFFLADDWWSYLSNWMPFLVFDAHLGLSASDWLSLNRPQGNWHALLSLSIMNIFDILEGSSWGLWTTATARARTFWQATWWRTLFRNSSFGRDLFAAHVDLIQIYFW